jgi:hypothetical protein
MNERAAVNNLSKLSPPIRNLVRCGMRRIEGVENILKTAAFVILDPSALTRERNFAQAESKYRRDKRMAGFHGFSTLRETEGWLASFGMR